MATELMRRLFPNLSEAEIERRIAASRAVADAASAREDTSRRAQPTIPSEDVEARTADQDALREELQRREREGAELRQREALETNQMAFLEADASPEMAFGTPADYGDTDAAVEAEWIQQERTEAERDSSNDVDRSRAFLPPAAGLQPIKSLPTTKRKH